MGLQIWKGTRQMPDNVRSSGEDCESSWSEPPNFHGTIYMRGVLLH